MAKTTTTTDAVSTSVKKAADVVKDKVDETASKVSEKTKGGLRGMMGKLKEKLSLKRKKSSSSSATTASLTVAADRPHIPICGSGNPKRRQ
ncbi:unnamed protein product [Bathycoccus prasinos]